MVTVALEIGEQRLKERHPLYPGRTKLIINDLVNSADWAGNEIN